MVVNARDVAGVFSPSLTLNCPLLISQWSADSGWWQWFSAAGCWGTTWTMRGKMVDDMAIQLKRYNTLWMASWHYGILRFTSVLKQISLYKDPIKHFFYLFRDPISNFFSLGTLLNFPKKFTDLIVFKPFFYDFKFCDNMTSDLKVLMDQGINNFRRFHVTRTPFLKFNVVFRVWIPRILLFSSLHLPSYFLIYDPIL